MEQLQSTLQLMWNFWPLLFLSGWEGAWKGRIKSVDPRGNSLKFMLISWGIFAFIRLELWMAGYSVTPILPEVLFWWSGALVAGIYFAYRLRQRTLTRRQAQIAARLAELRGMALLTLVENTAGALRQQGCQVEPAPEESLLHLLVTRPDGERQALMLRAGDYTVGKPAVQALSHALPDVNAALGLLLTPGDYTPAARQWADDKPLRLLDGAALVEFLDAPPQKNHSPHGLQ